MDFDGPIARLFRLKGNEIVTGWLGTCLGIGEGKGKHLSEVKGERGVELMGLGEMGFEVVIEKTRSTSGLERGRAARFRPVL